jgi:hypothetical protein
VRAERASPDPLSCDLALRFDGPAEMESSLITAMYPSTGTPG